MRTLSWSSFGHGKRRCFTQLTMAASASTARLKLYHDPSECDNAGSPDYSRVAEAVNVLQYVGSLKGSDLDRLRNAGLLSCVHWGRGWFASSSLRVDFIWNDTKLNMSVLDGFVAHARRGRPTSQRFSQMMEMLQREYPDDANRTPLRLVLVLETFTVPPIVAEEFAHKIADFASALVAHSPPSTCLTRFSLEINCPLVTASIARSFHRLHNTQLVSVLKYIRLDPLDIRSIQYEELAELLALVPRTGYEIEIKSSSLARKGLEVSEVRQVFDVARACPFITSFHIESVVERYVQDERLMDTFVAELGEYLQSHGNEIGRLACEPPACQIGRVAG